MSSAAIRPPEPTRQSATAEQILDLAETLIQTRSYSAFSYQDIADALGIRKASIHYHFPSKTELGRGGRESLHRAVRRRRSPRSARINRNRRWRCWISTFEPYLQFARTPDRVCLCGALAGEMPGTAARDARARRSFLHSASPVAVGHSQARRQTQRTQACELCNQDGSSDLCGLARRLARQAHDWRSVAIGGRGDSLEGAAFSSQKPWLRALIPGEGSAYHLGEDAWSPGR